MRLQRYSRILVGGRWGGYASALVLTALVTGFIGLVIGRVNIGNIAMVYLLAVLTVAAVFGVGPAIVASVAAFIAFDWFFIQPLHTFTVADPAEWLALVLFLVTAVITGGLAGELRRRARVAEQREREAAVLYDVVRLMAELDISQALQSVAERLRLELNVQAVGLDLVEEGRAPMRIVAGIADALPAAHAARKAMGEAPPAGPLHLHSIDLESHGQQVGMLYLSHLNGSPEFTSADNRLLSAVAGQVGLAVERRRLMHEATNAEILRKTDELKTALLNAVSHDLKTPLASILASAGALLQRDIQWSEGERRDFAEAIEYETRRLNQLVGNLLDLSRIEAGNLTIEKNWYDLSVLVDDVLGRLRPLTRQHTVSLRIPEELPPVQLSYVEIDQVLSNLVENAAKYAPAGTEICISAGLEGRDLRVEVSDRGPGLPTEALAKLFEPFYRVKGEVPQPRGIGLGLAVAKGLVEAHGGRIWAENRQEGGARFVFTLPLIEAGKATRSREPRE